MMGCLTRLIIGQAIGYRAFNSHGTHPNPHKKKPGSRRGTGLVQLSRLVSAFSYQCLIV
jgi:hypothetical protein